MVTIIEILILAVVQGLTEWLPISSSGHLVVTQKLLGLNLPLIYSVMLHVGTLIVVLTVFRKDVGEAIKALVERDFETEQGKLALFIAVGSVPIAILGFLFHDIFELLFSNLLAVGFALLVMGCILFVSESRIGNKRMNTFDSMVVGLAQAVSLIPGISRSGLTVSTGLLRSIDKSIAFRYSFLLSVPAILGATLMESRELIHVSIDVIPLLLGVAISMTVGYGTLRLLKKIVMKEKFHLFAIYCWTVGSAILLFSLFHL